MKRFAWLCVLVLSASISKAQDIQNLLTKSNAYHDAHPVEKMHLHLDKYSYTAGETIWFKAYTVVGAENLLSNLSHIAYVDLIAPNDEIVAHIKIPLTSGLGLGDITLSDTLVEGTYRLRGYNNWMRNDSSAYFFQQNLQISNGRLDDVLTHSGVQGEHFIVTLQNLQGAALAETAVRYQISKSGKSLKRGRIKTDTEGKALIPFKEEYGTAKLDLEFENQAQVPIKKIFKLPAQIQAPNSVQFFPEGGRILAGTLNKVAVKALRPNGMGIAAKTYILTSKKDTAAIIETNMLGMGSAPLFAEGNETLMAITLFADGSQTESTLPPFENTGYSIQVNNGNPAKLFAQVNLSPDKQDGKDIYFVVHHLGRSYYVSKQAAAKAELVFSVPKTSLPSGILTVSVLNADLIPLLERPVFIFRKDHQLPLTATTNSPAVGLRKKVSVSMESGTVSDSIRNAVISASVLNLSKIQDSTTYMPNILSSLLLSADLKGYIENPGYYFYPEVKDNEIDNLLLTQGWRKIDLSALPVEEPAFMPEKSITIKGQARKLGRKAPAPNAKMTLISSKNFMDYIDTVATEDGYFEFDNLFFPDSVKFLITAKDEKGKNNIDIIVPKIENPPLEANKNEPGERNDINAASLDDIQNSKQYFAGLEAQGLMEKSIAIQEVVVTAKSPRKKASENSANLNGPGNADQVISAEDLETCPSLDMCLNGRLMGVMFRNGIPYTTRGGGEMQVVLDGMYIEGDQLSMINPMDIQSVEVLRNVNYTAIYGSYGGNGLIIITSKTGKDAMRSYTPKGIVTVQPKGFHLNKTFYKPIYEAGSETQLQRDLRTTIHWEPNIVTDENGKAHFDFYTSDESGTYLINIEGLDFNGRLTQQTLRVEVK
ncbi:TonB-dependent receptor plug domain-containing protein [Sphingobacterium suaedae]|uniref:TonB-dependent receptor plug domain-containing protein n=1 Tax=Sphingobacterium suaedae TaxID=1686402 RepID=A0ABW5KDW9_9SPHI